MDGSVRTWEDRHAANSRNTPARAVLSRSTNDSSEPNKDSNPLGLELFHTLFVVPACNASALYHECVRGTRYGRVMKRVRFAVMPRRGRCGIV